MGCISSKKSGSPTTPMFDYNGATRDWRLGGLKSPLVDVEELSEEMAKNQGLGKFGRVSMKCRGEKLKETRVSATDGLGILRALVDGEYVAAGWPSWLCSAAGETVRGWLPLRADAFERLDKIGQGTYSTVYRARIVGTRTIVALKKVRFDNLKQRSIVFMAREIQILRSLDHPNIMKLEGIITSQSSHSIHLVFEYMEHDLSGLLSSPDVKFSAAQIKWYMKQLLSGIDHCHSRGVMHRDIKAANILVNNEGVLKVADFGLAKIFDSENSHPLTCHVVTLWYRPPELILGSTTYGSTVDMWSVGCVFAELLFGKPLLKGRNEEYKGCEGRRIWKEEWLW